MSGPLGPPVVGVARGRGTHSRTAAGRLIEICRSDVVQNAARRVIDWSDYRSALRRARDGIESITNARTRIGLRRDLRRYWLRNIIGGTDRR